MSKTQPILLRGANRLGHRSRIVLEQNSSENRLDYEVLQQMQTRTREELGEAELRIYRQLQKERYPNAFETLQLGLPVHPKEKIASLLPVWDERDKLIRVTGRVALALRDRNRASNLIAC